MPLSGHAAARRPAVLSLPGATPLLLTAVAGRLGYGVLPVAVLLALARSTGSLALATTLASVHGLVASVSLPVKGRLVDAFGAVVLRVGAVGALGSLVVAAMLAGSGVVLFLPAVLVGALVAPPLTAIVRGCWGPVLAGHDDLRDRAFALDAALEELAFLVGPAAGGVGVAMVGAGWVLAGSGALLLLAAWSLAHRIASAGARVRERRMTRTTGLGRATRLAAGVLLLASVLSGLVGAAVLARATSLSGAALYGVLLSLEGVGALLGLLVLGRPLRRLGAGPRTAVLAATSAGAALLLAGVVPSSPPVVLALAVLAVGLPSAVLVATLNAVVSSTEDPSRATEAFSVLVTCQNLGGLAGFALGGVLAEAAGPASPVVAGVTLAVVGWLLVVPALGRALRRLSP